MSEPSLSFHARMALLLLVDRREEVSNTELKDEYGFSIGKKHRDELEKAGYIKWRRGRRQVVIHRLTDTGWQAARAEMAAGPAPGIPKAYRILFRKLAEWEAGMADLGLDLADFYPVSQALEPDPVRAASKPGIGSRVIAA